MKSKWIKASDKMPEVGRLIVERTPYPTYDEDDNEQMVWEYDAGITKKYKNTGSIYIEVAHGEYQSTLDYDSEWQYLEE